MIESQVVAATVSVNREDAVGCPAGLASWGVFRGELTVLEVS